MAKKCPPGKYYCFTDKKCKKIPRGYRIGSRGYLARDNRSDSGNLRLRATPTSADSTVFKLSKPTIKV